MFCFRSVFMFLLLIQQAVQYYDSSTFVPYKAKVGCDGFVYFCDKIVVLNDCHSHTRNMEHSKRQRQRSNVEWFFLWISTLFKNGQIFGHFFSWVFRMSFLNKKNLTKASKLILKSKYFNFFYHSNQWQLFHFYAPPTNAYLSIWMRCRNALTYKSVGFIWYSLHTHMHTFTHSHIHTRIPLETSRQRDSQYILKHCTLTNVVNKHMILSTNCRVSLWGNKNNAFQWKTNGWNQNQVTWIITDY